jgi:orotidine-5'-phosphate decarboxylase
VRFDAIKINYPLALSCGLEIVSEIAQSSPVICDFKVADIPNTNRLIVEQAIKYGASGVIVHGFVGHDSVEACVKAAESADVFVVTEMSHPGGTEFTAKIANQLVVLAKETGAKGIIAYDDINPWCGCPRW